ncbi:ATP-dependent sacrificial sulfur transferase LarE [Candidatus Margulisiibacteriota bacterium]
MNHLNEILENLKKYILRLESCVVAFSGGVDSTLLLTIAHEVLGDNCIAVISITPSMSSQEESFALSFVKEHSIPYQIVETKEFENEDFLKNDTNRCYFCKFELFKACHDIADTKGFKHIIDGSNADDVSDYRPGFKAAEELQVLHPFIECGLTKSDIRELSRTYNLPTSEKPASPCLASRVAYGSFITPEKLNMIDLAEQYLRNQGFPVVRVRVHDEAIARIEIPQDNFNRFHDLNFNDIVSHFKELGFSYVTFDLQGFRSGSSNEVVQKEVHKT